MVTSAYFPFIEPDAQAVRTQPFCNGAHYRFVLRAMAQENIVCEIVSHISPLAPHFSSYQGAERHEFSLTLGRYPKGPYNCSPRETYHTASLRRFVIYKDCLLKRL